MSEVKFQKHTFLFDTLTILLSTLGPYKFSMFKLSENMSIKEGIEPDFRDFGIMSDGSVVKQFPMDMPEEDREKLINTIITLPHPFFAIPELTGFDIETDNPSKLLTINNTLIDTIEEMIQGDLYQGGDIIAAAAQNPFGDCIFYIFKDHGLWRTSPTIPRTVMELIEALNNDQASIQ